VAHLKLHTLTRSNSGGNKPRVIYIPEAVPQYAEEMRKTENRRRRSAKFNKRSESVE
jgi:hypothetical protein